MNRRNLLTRTAAVVLTFALAGAAIAQPTPDAPAKVTAQDAEIYRLQIGTVHVTALSDGSVPQDLHKLLQGATHEQIDALLSRNFESNPSETSINVFLIELPGKLVLVDTGSGQLFGPNVGGGLLAGLRRAGFGPEQITDVLLTHAHSDHAGGLVHDGARVFVNAVVHVGQPDVDFFLTPENAKRTGYDPQYFAVAETTLRPYLNAEKVKPFAADGEVVPGVTATLHPGHTPGSAFYTLRSQGETLVFVGDIIHSSAVQFSSPRTTIAYDEDPKEAAHVRQTAFADFTRDRTLIAAPHLGFPGIGHVRAADVGFEWVPVIYSNRAGH